MLQLFPHDILTFILDSFSIQILGKLSCVCKSWDSVISKNEIVWKKRFTLLTGIKDLLEDENWKTISSLSFSLRFLYKDVFRISKFGYKSQISYFTIRDRDQKSIAVHILIALSLEYNLPSVFNYVTRQFYPVTRSFTYSFAHSLLRAISLGNIEVLEEFQSFGGYVSAIIWEDSLIPHTKHNRKALDYVLSKGWIIEVNERDIALLDTRYKKELDFILSKEVKIRKNFNIGIFCNYCKDIQFTYEFLKQHSLFKNSADYSTFLKVALAGDSLELCKELVTLGATIPFRAINFVLSGKADAKIVRWLLSFKDKKYCEHVGSFAYGALSKKSEEKAIELLKEFMDCGEYFPPLACLYWTQYTGRYDVLKDLIAANVITKEEIDKQSLLHTAKTTEALKVLLEAGAKVDAIDSFNRGCQPIHTAAKRGLIQNIKILVENGADVNAVDNLGSTPLHYVFVLDPPLVYETIDTLVQLGASTTVSNKNGDTPMHLAAARLPEIPKSFVHEDVTNNQGYTPLSFAIENKDVKKIEYLLALGASVELATRKNIMSIGCKYYYCN